MKKVLLFSILFLLCSLAAFSQDTTDLLPEVRLESYFKQLTDGCHRTGKTDTVPAVMLVTECDNCPAKPTRG